MSGSKVLQVFRDCEPEERHDLIPGALRGLAAAIQVACKDDFFICLQRNLRG